MIFLFQREQSYKNQTLPMTRSRGVELEGVSLRLHTGERVEVALRRCGGRVLCRGESGVEERRVGCVLHGHIPGGFAGSVMWPWELKLRLAPGTKARALPLKVHP